MSRNSAYTVPFYQTTGVTYRKHYYCDACKTPHYFYTINTTIRREEYVDRVSQPHMLKMHNDLIAKCCSFKCKKLKFRDLGPKPFLACDEHMREHNRLCYAVHKEIKKLEAQLVQFIDPTASNQVNLTILDGLRRVLDPHGL